MKQLRHPHILPHPRQQFLPRRPRRKIPQSRTDPLPARIRRQRPFLETVRRFVRARQGVGCETASVQLCAARACEFRREPDVDAGGLVGRWAVVSQNSGLDGSRVEFRTVGLRDWIYGFESACQRWNGEVERCVGVGIPTRAFWIVGLDGGECFESLIW